MVILWVANIPHGYGLRHGATLRYVNFSRELIGRNNSVYFVLTKVPSPGREQRNKFLEDLVKGGQISGFFEMEQIPAPLPGNKFGRFHPGLRSRAAARALGP